MDLFFFDKRPLLLPGVGACCGIYIATGQSWLYGLVTAAVLIGVGLLFKTSKRMVIASCLVMVIFSLWGYLAGAYYDTSYKDFENADCNISGKVVSVDKIKARYTLLTIRPDGFLKRKLKVYLFDNTIDFIQGDGILLLGSISKPGSSTNPGGYDSRKLLYSDGISAMVFCSEGDAMLTEAISPGYLFGLIRRDIKNSCCEFLGDKNGNLVTAMLIGDKTGLDPLIEEDFRNSGLSHTMAVSGSHVAYILVPLYFIFSKFCIRRYKYYPWLILILVFFALLAGMQPSVLRASLTAIIMLVGGLVERNPEPLNSLAASALILMALNPFCIYDAGFILSYSSVISILVFYKPIVKILGRNPVSAIIAMSTAVQIGLLPVTAKLFYSVQLFSVFSNIIVFPVRALLAVSGWLMYLLSCILHPVGRVLAPVVGILADMMSSTANLFAGTKWSVFNVPYIHPIILFIYYAALFLMFRGKKIQILYPAVAAIIISVYFLFFAIPRNTWIFFDSEKADCFIIKTVSGRDIMVDTGEYMLGNSIAHFAGDYIDAIFLSHAHDDHIGGLEDILKRFRVGIVYIPGCRGAGMSEVIKLCANSSVPCKSLIAGDVIIADGCCLEIQNPVDCSYLSLNDTSMVIKLTCRGKSLLLCGDCEIPAELDMLDRQCNLGADVLKVPHHGALNAANIEFFEAVDADIAIISCGADDKYHPSVETLDRLSRCRVYRSDLHGAVIIKLTKKGFRISTENK